MISKKLRRQDLSVTAGLGAGTLAIDALLVGGVSAWLAGPDGVTAGGVVAGVIATAALFSAQLAIVALTCRSCAAARRTPSGERSSAPDDNLPRPKGHLPESQRRRV